MTYKRMAFFWVFILIVCCRCERNPCSLSKETLKNIAKLDSLCEVPEFRERMNGWIRSSYNESPIDSTGNETYRFIKSPPFDNSEVYRIEKREEGYFAIFKEIDIHIEVYRSLAGSSFEKDFYLRILHEDIDFFGWEILEGEDTIYYRSKSKLKRDILGMMSIRFKDYQLSRKKTTESTLDYFDEDYSLSLSYAELPFLFPYSNFFEGVVYGDSIKIFANRDVDSKNFDELKFERVR